MLGAKCSRKRDTSLIVHVLVCLFGLSSWVAIHGVLVELPLMVQHLPEGWSLASYLIFIIQMANVGPLLFVIGFMVAPRFVHERKVIYGLLAVGAAACLLLMFFWKSTAVVGAYEHSVVLFVLHFCLAMSDCTSSVTYLPFMSVFKPQYMKTYFIGEGLSGLLPSLVALSQGSGAIECVNQSYVNMTSSTNETVFRSHARFLQPYFPVRYFFFFLFMMMVVSGVVFLLLNNLSLCKLEKVAQAANMDPDGNCKVVLKTICSFAGESFPSKSWNFQQDTKTLPNLDRGFRFQSTLSLPGQNLKRVDYAYMLVLTWWVNALGNGVLPSIQSYSCLPYGIVPYHLAATLGNMSNPLACILLLFLPKASNLMITLATIAGTGIAAYILAVASLSPEPFLKHETHGAALVVTAWVLVVFCLTYTKVSIATLFRDEGRKALLWCGAVTQLGSASGAVVMFLLVNVVKQFVSSPLCA